MEDIKILYEDKYIIVAEKPCGIVSQERADGGDSMYKRLSQYRQNNGEDGYIGVLHRLDTVTGGIITYSKEKKSTGEFSSLVTGDGYIKEYICVVQGKMEESNGVLCDFLYFDRQKNKSYVVKGERKGAKRAELEYFLLDVKENSKGEELSLLKIRLHTGRTHQIRVQLASRKHPLCGDGKYGSKDNNCSCALWSYSCRFTHIKNNKEIFLKSYPEDIYPWNLFDIKNRL